MSKTLLLALVLGAPIAMGPLPDGHPVSVFERLAHLVSVATLLGGLAFFFVLSKDEVAMTKRPEERPWYATWRTVSTRATLGALVSGLYFAVRDVPGRKGDKVFHSLFGAKMVLAVLVFFFAAASVGRAKCLAFVRRNRPRYLHVALMLGTVAVALGVLIRAHKAGNLSLAAFA